MRMMRFLCCLVVFFSVSASPTFAADDINPFRLDWDDISYEKHRNAKSNGNWEARISASYYRDADYYNSITQNSLGEFDSDNAVIGSLIYRYNDRINRSFSRFYRFQLTRKIGYTTSSNRYYNATFSAGARYRFSNDAQLIFPVDLRIFKYPTVSNLNDSIGIRFSPEVRFRLNDREGLRIRGEIEVAKFPNSDLRDNLRLKLKPTWYHFARDDLTFTYSVSAERRSSRASEFSRTIVGFAATATYDLNSVDYVDVLLAYSHTKYDSHPTPGTSPLHTGSFILEASYGKKLGSYDGLNLSVALGIERFETFSRQTSNVAPYITIGLRKRF
jgi:hypothetical protein